MKKNAPFDAADYLDSDEVIAEYLNAALEDENPDVFFGCCWRCRKSTWHGAVG